MRNFSEGDKVVLTDSMKRTQVEPEKYESGVVVYVASWHVVGVKWNGTDKPVAMLADEIEKVAE